MATRTNGRSVAAPATAETSGGPAPQPPVKRVFFGRLALLAAIIVALFTLGGDSGRLSMADLAAPVLIALAANVVLLFFSAPRLADVQPLITLAGDIAFLLAFSAASRANDQIIIISSVSLMIIHLLGGWGGLSIAQPILVAAAAIGSHIAFGVRTPTDASTLYLVVGAIGSVAAGAAFIFDRTVGVLVRQVHRLMAENQGYVTDTRERASALSELTFTLSSTLNYNKVLDATLEAGRLALRFPEAEASALIGAVYLYHVSDGMLHVVSARRFTRADEARSLAGKAGVVGQALKDAAPVIGGEADHDPELQVLVAFQYCKSTLCIPLRAGFDTFGVIVFGSERKGAFSADQGEVLNAIGLQSTIALQNAVLYSNLLTEKERIIDADEEARKKLARDLHDGPTQGVAAIAMRMSYIKKLFAKQPDSPDMPDELNKVEELARKTTKEMRHMLFTLRPLVLETQGLSAAFNQLSAKFFELYKQTVNVRVDSDVEDYLDSPQQGTIFYIVEEAVNNARKHAQAKSIDISARRRDDVAIVQVRDNGVGFNVEKMQENYEKQTSLGMVNMRERTELLDGTLRLESTPGKGTTITLIVPLKSREATQANNFAQPRTKLAQAAKQRIERGTLDNHLNREGSDGFQF